MNETVIIATAIALLVFFGIRPYVNQKYPEARLPTDLMVIAVGSTLVLSHIIDAVATGTYPVAVLFIVLSILIGNFAIYGITHRKEVAQTMRRNYYRILFGYSSIFFSLGVLMFFSVSFMPKVIL